MAGLLPKWGSVYWTISIKQSSSLSIFKTNIKTNFFKKAYKLKLIRTCVYFSVVTLLHTCYFCDIYLLFIHELFCKHFKYKLFLLSLKDCDVM